ncbi:MAG: DUF4921 family protein [Caldicoprobacterales bacterium]
MPQIRRDPFTNEEVVIVVERSKRPSHWLTKDNYKDDTYRKSNNCFFCRGNESSTPPESFRINDMDGDWIVRSFPNKFPIFSPNSRVVQEREGLFDVTNGTGTHEVIVEHYKHDKNFFNMSVEEFKYMILAYRERYTVLYNEPFTQYVSLFKNYLKEAGASINHPHSQIISLPIVSNKVMMELHNCKRFYDDRGESLHEVVIREEKKRGDRVILESDSFIVITPFASKYKYETEIIYKKDDLFQSIPKSTIGELSEVFFNLFNRYRKVLGIFPFNLILHGHPKSMEDIFYKWHFHIVPRLSYHAGFELSTGVYVNDVLPEEAAKQLVSSDI